MYAYVKLECGCTIVEAKQLKQAERFARWEFDNRNVLFVHKATKEEIEWNEAMGGIVHRAEEK